MLARVKAVQAAPQKRPLRPYQKQAIDYMGSVNHFALFMQMRLGKTLTAIRFAQDTSNEVRTCVVVAPLTVLEAWKRELDDEGENYVLAAGKTQYHKEQAFYEAYCNTDLGERTWVLINYESLLAMCPIEEKLEYGKIVKKYNPHSCLHLDWDMFILDESTRIKNPEAHITKVLTRGCRNVKHRGILSGLPSPEGLIDLYCQFKFLHGSFMGCDNYYRYRSLYFISSTFETYSKSGLAMDIKRAVEEKAFMLNRRDAGIPDVKVYEKRFVEMEPAQKRMYNEVMKNYAATLASGDKVETMYAITQSLWLRRICGGFSPDGVLLSSQKLRAVVDLIQGELAGEKVVVFYAFKREIEEQAKLLDKAGIHHTVCTGDNSSQRGEQLRRFREYRGQSVFLATESTAKFGINLSCASAALYYSNEWSCEARTQSEDRILDVADKSPLLYVDFICKNTVDEDMVEAVKSKKLSAQSLMVKLESLIWQQAA